MITTLKNLNILITRPEHQAQKLIQIIQALNGNPILFSTITIVDVENTEPMKSVIKNLAAFDMAIFVSANAVEKTLNFFHEEWPKRTRIFAVGAGTAAVLQKFNLPAALYPKENFSSEGLLALPELQLVDNKRIIIFKGEGGRDLLAKTLRARSAQVTETDVYKRIRPAGFLKLVDNIDVMICTSLHGLQNLYDMCEPQLRVQLLKKQLLVISERMVFMAQQLGFVKIPLVADNATDLAILDVLMRFAGEKHGRRK